MENNKKTLSLLLVIALIISSFSFYGNSFVYADIEGSGSQSSYPVPGNCGAVDIIITTDNVVSLSWIEATDDITTSDLLEYKVYYSVNEMDMDTVDDVADIEANGMALNDYEANITTKEITGLGSRTHYNFYVIVKDNENLKSIYDKVSVTTNIFKEKGLEVTIGNTTEDLINMILGEGIKADNVTIKGAVTTSSAGIFTGGNDIIGFEEGIILSSGNAKDVVGPNLDAGITTAYETEGDEDLTTLSVMDSTYDASVIEFDFIPENETISFQYVFTSEEYNDYANGSVNDVFAFILNGQNIAVLPESTTPVSINTVNGGNPYGVNPKNQDYYINNAREDEDGDIKMQPPKLNTEMDGLTIVMSVSAKVNKGEINHIKLAIADGGDSAFDSNVFIKANSIKNRKVAPGQIFIDSRKGQKIYIKRNNGTDGTVKVDFIAKDSEENELVSEQITFGDGEDTKTVTVPVETKVVVIQNPIGGATIDSSKSNLAFEDISDKLPPEASNETITISNETTNSVQLTWEKATDDITTPSLLEYQVYYSNKNNIDTLENIKTNGTSVCDYEVDVNTKTVIGLNSNTQYFFNVIVKDEEDNESVYKCIGTKTLKSSSTSSSSSKPSYKPINANDGNEEYVIKASATTKREGSKTVTTITFNERSLESFLKGLPETDKDISSKKNVINITGKKNCDKVVGQLSGNMVKGMEEKDIVVEVSTDKASYSLPAKEIDIDNVLERLGNNIKLKDIKVNIEVTEPNSKDVKIIKSITQKKGLTIVVPPVEFNVTCTYNSKKIEVKKFNSYVKRTIALPTGVDYSKITTAIVNDPEGRIRHLPTKVIIKDGRYYAVVNSLTNSIYTLIYNEEDFTDIKGHWGEEDINDLASRLIIAGETEDIFNPEKEMTRAEFTKLVVRALGLKAENIETGLIDLDNNLDVHDYICTAFDYKIVKGFPGNIFKSEKLVKRIEAMIIVTRAMKMAGYNMEITDSEIKEELSKFDEEVPNWAKEEIATGVKYDVVKGYNRMLRLDNNVTKAEATALLRRILKNLNLI